MTRRIRVAASPARVAAQTGPIPAGKHLAQRMPMPYREDRRDLRVRIVSGLALILPAVAVVIALASGVFHG